jgi:hypothetical protein
MVFRDFIYRFATVDAFSYHSWFKSVDLFLILIEPPVAESEGLLSEEDKIKF